MGQYIFENYLSYRQYGVLKRTSLPSSLKSEIPKESFDKSQDYSRAKERFSFISDTYSLVQNLLIVKYDLLPKIWSFSATLMESCKVILPKFMNGVITQSIFFMIFTTIASSIISLPLSYYSNFVLEEKYGFNKLTIKLWITDLIKTIGLSMVFIPPIMGGFLKIIDYYGDSFIVYVCGFTLAVQLIMMTIFPTLIQPLFNKITPLDDGDLKTAIEDLAKSQQFPLTKLYVIDGSKRSSHSNAYFTGLPWSKQIVLFDTLIEHSTIKETVAVLAHEIGHWKLNHLPKLLIFSQLNLFLTFSLFSAFVKNDSLFKSFGFFGGKPIIIGFMLFNDIFKPVESVLQFIMNLLSRKHEFEADAHAKKCGYSLELGKSLIKLNIENLSYMDADWLYSSYHRSHPILTERLNAIGYESTEKVSKND